MSKALFVVPVADVERGPRTLSFTLDEAWLRGVFEGTEATPRRAGSATVELSKSGREIMVRGRAEVAVTMPCVVTLDPLEIDLNPEIFLMLAPAPSAEPGGKGGKAGPAGQRGQSSKKRAHPGTDAPTEARRAPSRKRGADDEDEEGELLDAVTAARDTFEGSQIELDSFFREFLLLELPMYPRRSDLPSSPEPAIGPRLVTPEPDEQEHIDPRLQPLAALRSRLRDSKE
ncbi:MAG TPA: DUF177 domain-containing protein [Polyangiaceae bacterium]|nr:DUF177 domain-containing protein [Polyangiaceae bacterium]